MQRGVLNLTKEELQLGLSLIKNSGNLQDAIKSKLQTAISQPSDGGIFLSEEEVETFMDELPVENSPEIINLRNKLQAFLGSLRG